MKGYRKGSMWNLEQYEKEVEREKLPMKWKLIEHPRSRGEELLE